MLRIGGSLDWMEIRLRTSNRVSSRFYNCDSRLSAARGVAINPEVLSMGSGRMRASLATGVVCAT